MFLPNKKDAIHKAWLYRTLSEIADDAFLVSMLRFKGGTCAAMRQLLDRFSVDLDFDFVGNTSDLPEVMSKMESIFTKLGLEIKDNSKKTAQYFLKYNAPPNTRNTLKIDTFFPPLVGNTYEAVRLKEIDRVMHCQTTETMFANKLIALIDRFKKGNHIAARDVYDVHHFFLQNHAYDTNIIQAYIGNHTLKDFFTELANFVKTQITQRMIDQDLNMLLSADAFSKIRKTLLQETVMLLKDEAGRL